MEFGQAVDEALGFYNSSASICLRLKDKQRECLQHVFNGRDVVANLPTSYGKSLIFHLLPGLLSRKHSIPTAMIVVVCPLNVIQEDQQKTLSDRGLRTCILDYKCTNSKQVMQEEFDVVFCHPEAFFSTEAGQALIRKKAFQDRVYALVIDECHKAEEWSKLFRKAYAELYTLRTFFQNVPLLALSGTLTTAQLAKLPDLLGLSNFVVASLNPDRPNIFLERRVKDIADSAVDTYERIYGPLIDELHADPHAFPVTLLYLPMERSADCVHYCMQKFGFNKKMEDVPYAPVFSRQAKSVTRHVTQDLKKDNPHVRLVLCTAAVGMGFDPPCVDRVIHACAPRRLSDYFQQVGRAGRSGQAATATLYCTPGDIKKGLPGLQDDIVEYCETVKCLRSSILTQYGFAKNADSPRGCRCCSNCKVLCKCVSCI